MSVGTVRLAWRVPPGTGWGFGYVLGREFREYSLVGALLIGGPGDGSCVGEGRSELCGWAFCGGCGRVSRGCGCFASLRWCRERRVHHTRRVVNGAFSTPSDMNAPFTT